MIKSVNHKDFEAFGVVFAEKGQPSALINGHSVAVSNTETAVYQTVTDTWLGCEMGMPVLSVSTKTGENLDFHLDRTVRLKAGVEFHLTALGGPAAVQMAGLSIPRLLRTTIAEKQAMGQTLRVTKLCAFLYQEKEPGFLFPGEAQPMPELVYVDAGKMHAVVDGREILLEQGDMVLYGKDQWHTQHADRNETPRLVTVSFEAKGADLEKLCNRRIHLPPRAVAILQEMLREQARMDDYSGDMLISLLQMLLLTLLREEDARRETGQATQCLSSENQIIRAAQQYVASHIMEKLTVPLLAENVDISVSYLTALFHKHLQISPGEYIRRMKLQKSKLLIREGKLNLSQIAKALEYSTVQHFSRQFKQMFGMTPSEYGKSVQ
ncbi:MAG: helix-turn-helix transcriptional regulator [Oscillospiraceae bacterium]|nr:helix-turn-helix transcriptional regulator [Oscillospiraceae bacterium]